MNDLTVFNKDIIPVYITDTDRKVVIGRELHERLKIGTPYGKWFPRMCEYGFTENKDYATEDKNVRRADGTEMPQMQHDHYLTLDMAKHMADNPFGNKTRLKTIQQEIKRRHKQ